MKSAALSQILWVGAGGFVGSVFRYAVSGLVQERFSFSAFPYGTLTVNVLGCFLIGVLGGFSESRQVFGPEMRLFLFLGLLGGFTTFSTLGYETLALMRDGEYLKAAASVGLHIFAGLAAVWLGYVLGRLR